MEELVKEQPVYEIQKVKIKNNQLTGSCGKAKGSNTYNIIGGIR